MSPVLPPLEKDEEVIGRNAYLPASVWDRLGEIAEETKADDPNGKGYSRNEVVVHFLRWAIEEYQRDRERRPKKK